MSKEKNPLFTDEELTALADEINGQYGYNDQSEEENEDPEESQLS